MVVTFYRRHSDFHSPNAFFVPKRSCLFLVRQPLFLANLVNYDTRDDAPCRVRQRVHLHPTFAERLWLCADALTQQTAKCSMFFSATEKKGRLVKSPVAMHTFHIFFTPVICRPSSPLATVRYPGSCCSAAWAYSRGSSPRRCG